LVLCNACADINKQQEKTTKMGLCSLSQNNLFSHH